MIVRGQREVSSKNEQSSDHRVERTYGLFAASFATPETVDPEKVAADDNNGLPQITPGPSQLWRFCVP